MEYIYVASAKTSDVEMEKEITKQTKNSVYSIIHGVKQKNFGLHSVEVVACNIREYSERCIKPFRGNLFTDSGGYSFIRGDIEPTKLDLLIDCYTVYLKHECQIYDSIFSLDIPFSLKHPEFNTCNNVHEANYKSLSMAKKNLEKDEVLQKKFYFVWHFKIKEQYEIWKKLYKDLKLNQYVKNHAIGGMVGLKKITKIRFSPFTGMSFYALNTYLQSNAVCSEFRLHFLGVYSPYDRFHIAFLEALFRDYLRGIASDIVMSYDSINPVHTARMNRPLPLFYLDGENLVVIPKLIDIPDFLISKVTSNKQHADIMREEIERRRNGHLLVNSGAFCPINVFSNLELDRFFTMLINKYNFVNELKDSRSPVELNGRITAILCDIGYNHPGVFSKSMRKSIVLTLEKTWHWHNWFVNFRNSDSKLDELMHQTIREINFPINLSR